MPLHYHSDFHPELGYLCALAVLFSKQPPQLNCLPDSVPPDVQSGQVRNSRFKEWYYTCRLAAPTYATQSKHKFQCQGTVKLHGVFLSCYQ